MARRVAQLAAALGVLAATPLGCTPAPKVEAPFTPVPASQTAADAGEAGDEAEPTKTNNARRMHEWFVQLATLQDAAIAADGAALSTRARKLGEGIDLVDAVPEPWQAHATELRTQVLRLADPQRAPADAAAALARATSTCGACHTATEVVSAVEAALPDDGDPPGGDRMDQHAWAARRMWEGLVTPSERRWVRGTAAFSLLPTCDAHSGAEGDDASDECNRAFRLARRAHNVESWEDRTAVYGELLTTCAGCHAKAEVAGAATGSL